MLGDSMAALNLLVSGRAGVGKTTLVEHVVQKLRGRLRVAGFTTTEVAGSADESKHGRRQRFGTGLRVDPAGGHAIRHERTTGAADLGIQSQPRFLRTGFGGEQPNYSERTAQLIDEQVRRIIEAMYGRAKAILTRRRTELERIAAELINKETLERGELDRLLSSSDLTTAAPPRSRAIAS